MTPLAGNGEFLLAGATEQDAGAIHAVIASRPGALTVDWTPPRGAAYVLARTEAGEVVAFLAVRLEPEAVWADQLECLWADGEPTQRGVRAMRELRDALHQVADSLGLTTYTVVNEANERHLAVLRKQGYVDVPVRMLAREAK